MSLVLASCPTPMNHIHLDSTYFQSRTPSKQNHHRRHAKPSPTALPPRRAKRTDESTKKKNLSDIPPNPPNTAGRSQTLSRVEIIATLTEVKARRHHSWARGIGSSARLESVAHVENTVMDVYYRNDSMKSERGDLLVELLN